MKEKTLLKIAVVTALAGIFVLYLISDNINLDESLINRIEDEDIGNDVKIKGVVSDVFNGEKVSIITIRQPEDMKVVVMENISLSEGDFVEIIGEVDEYNGEMEVIGNRVRVIS